MGMLCELGPLSAGRLAELTGLTTGAITGVLSRLERHGYARRIPHLRDRRSVTVKATNVSRFRRQMERMLGPLGKKMRAFSSRYSIQQMILIDEFIKGAVAISRGEIARIQSELRASN